jgi:hypothetical protein
MAKNANTIVDRRPQRLIVCRCCGATCERKHNAQVFCDLCGSPSAIKRRWAKRNSDKVRVTKALWQSANLQKANAASKRWYHKNVAASRRSALAKVMRKYRNDPQYRLNARISNAVRVSLKGVKCRRRWQSLVGYSIDQLRVHIERQFVAGMTWANYGPTWHIDHILPLVSFTYETAEDPDFRAAWALSNLRPLWARDNMSKNDQRTHLL